MPVTVGVNMSEKEEKGKECDEGKHFLMRFQDSLVTAIQTAREG
jgi:hypothetical protein